MRLCPEPHWGSLQRSPDQDLDLRDHSEERGGGKVKGKGGKERRERKKEKIWSLIKARRSKHGPLAAPIKQCAYSEVHKFLYLVPYLIKVVTTPVPSDLLINTHFRSFSFILIVYRVLEAFSLNATLIFTLIIIK